LKSKNNYLITGGWEGGYIIDCIFDCILHMEKGVGCITASTYRDLTKSSPPPLFLIVKIRVRQDVKEIGGRTVCSYAVKYAA